MVRRQTVRRRRCLRKGGASRSRQVLSRSNRVRNRRLLLLAGRKGLRYNPACRPLRKSRPSSSSNCGKTSTPEREVRLGHARRSQKGRRGQRGKVLEAQLAVDGTSGKHPEFKGNVATVYTNHCRKAVAATATTAETRNVYGRRRSHGQGHGRIVEGQEMEESMFFILTKASRIPAMVLGSILALFILVTAGHSILGQ